MVLEKKQILKPGNLCACLDRKVYDSAKHENVFGSYRKLADFLIPLYRMTANDLASS